jgi:glycine cleavage system H protein
MNTPDHLQYTQSHEWVLPTGENAARIGISDYAQNALGSLVFVTLPEIGESVRVEQGLAEVESVKAVSEVLSPFTAAVSAVNGALIDAPERINEDPYGAWIGEVSGISERGALLSAAEYEAFCQGIE